MADERFASEATGSRYWPTELRLNRAAQVLTVRFDDGSHFDLPAEFLRVESPSAEVQGHTPAQKQLVHGKRRVAITGVDPVGNYAVRLTFDDGHDSGIYSWTLLHRLGRDHDSLWQSYLAALAARGLERG
ncbi:hypothetical protein CHU95_06725 [Niveispirillum lacus]|uniref:Gamma-butyrobetaine hydroxylase-like N-terminal domain-containing protein n=1 Tax=Niveispirillum lacus TaxID=1981099 RepID=A0A255Z581_9PROT|nr:DUF971 domain-containing protein [Niveispirillum lacus]OYQ36035.1 hypothetical protein CHU95_06725 [Niveispirillum lacus]